MSSDFPAEQMLATAKGSPAAVARHDKAAWLELFAEQSLVNDPVGSRAHTDADARDRFYDTFIAPNDIRFDVAHDIVCGRTVARDVVIRITMGTGLEVTVPAHLRYELVEQGGDLRIAGLFAHWELMPMVRDTLGAGLKGWITYARLTVLMVARQGLAGVLGFMRGFRSAGRVGKRRGRHLLEGLARGDAAAVEATADAGVAIELPVGSRASIAEAAERLRGARFSKLIVSGHTLTASLQLGDKPGIALIDFDRARRIKRLRFYLE